MPLFCLLLDHGVELYVLHLNRGTYIGAVNTDTYAWKEGTQICIRGHVTVNSGIFSFCKIVASISIV